MSWQMGSHYVNLQIQHKQDRSQCKTRASKQRESSEWQLRGTNHLLQNHRAPWSCAHRLWQATSLFSSAGVYASLLPEILRLGSTWLLNVIIPRTWISYYKSFLGSLPGVRGKSPLTLSRGHLEGLEMTSSAKAQSPGGEAPGFRAAEGFGWRREKMKSICTVYVVEGNICMYYIYMMYLAMYINDICSYTKIDCVHILNSNIQWTEIYNEMSVSYVIKYIIVI